MYGGVDSARHSDCLHPYVSKQLYKNFMFALIGLPTLVHTIILLINGN